MERRAKIIDLESERIKEEKEKRVGRVPQTKPAFSFLWPKLQEQAAAKKKNQE